jgi:hypothetical protein
MRNEKVETAGREWLRNQEPEEYTTLRNVFILVPRGDKFITELGEYTEKKAHHRNK